MPDKAIMNAWAERLDWHDADRAFYLDGIGPLPHGGIGPLMEFIGSADEALALWGKAQGLIEHDFGAPVGKRTCLVLEKFVLVYLPENAVPWDQQGVSVGLLAEVLAPTQR
jgi:hypothetical protein